MEHKANKEVMEGNGEERALAHNKTRKRKWIGHTLEGDPLLRIVIERKSCCIGWWQLYKESLKMRPNSESSADFDQMNLRRKQKVG